MTSTIPLTSKPTMGASIHPIASRETSDLDLPAQQAPYYTNPSATSLPAPTPATEIDVEAETYDPTSTDPFSPFYSHARASESRSRVHTRSSTAQDIDLEKGNHTGVTISTVLSNGSAAPKYESQQQGNSLSPRCQNKPSLLCRSEAKKARGWWRNLSKGQRLLVHGLVALLFIGGVTALGLGVSKAMGTGIWKTESSTSKPIGEET